MQDSFQKDKQELIIIVAEKAIRDYNENIQLRFSPSSIEAMSFISEDVVVGINAFNKETGKNVSNIRINVRLND